MFAAVSAHFECCGQTLRLYSSPRHPLQSQQESWALTHGMSASMIPPTDRQRNEKVLNPQWTPRLSLAKKATLKKTT